MNTKTINRLKDISLAIYDKNHSVRTFHVSFILLKNKIIAISTNDARTSPLNLKNPRVGRLGEIIDDKGSCSEMRALLKVRNKTNIDFRKLTIVNTRVVDIKGNLSFSISKPCSSCLSLIRFLDLKEVFYTDKNGLIQQL